MGNDKSRSVDRTDHSRVVGHPEVIVGPSGIRQGSAILSSVNHPPIILGTSSFTATGWRGSFHPKENRGQTERVPQFFDEWRLVNVPPVLSFPSSFFRADLCQRLGRIPEAPASYDKAFALARQEPERRFSRGGSRN
jgi:hypothetical protein